MSMILEINHLNKLFGPLHAVNDVSLTILKGQTMSIVGESGCGKTTLAKMIAGLIRPDSGQIKFQGKVQMVFQDPFSSLDPLYTVKDILKEAFYRHKIIKSVQEQRISETLNAVGLEAGVVGRLPHEFSGGQRQRIAIARALLAQADILVLDEPTSALDVLVQKQIIDLLSSLKQQFCLTYIFISHNLRVVKHFSDTIAVMCAGKIVEQGVATEIFAHPRQTYTRQLLSAALEFKMN